MRPAAVFLIVGLAVSMGACGQADGRDEVESALAAAESVIAPTVEPMVEVRRQPLNPWQHATTVRLYVAEPGGAHDRYIEPAGRLLSPELRAEVERNLAIVEYDRHPDAVASCFVPHHWLRYYDGDGRQIGQVAVCFCCAGVSTEPDIGPRDGRVHRVIEFGDLEAVIQKMGLPTDVDCEGQTPLTS